MTGLGTVTSRSPSPPPSGPLASASGRKPAHRLLPSGTRGSYSGTERQEPTRNRKEARSVLETQVSKSKTQKAVARREGRGGVREGERNPGGRVPPPPLQRSRCEVVRPTHMWNLPSPRLLRTPTGGTETRRESFSREKPRQGRSTGRSTRKLLAPVAPPMCGFCLRGKSLLRKGQQRRLTARPRVVGKPRQTARTRLPLHEACVT